MANLFDAGFNWEELRRMAKVFAIQQGVSINSVSNVTQGAMYRILKLRRDHPDYEIKHPHSYLWKVVRRELIDRNRKKNALKRGGGITTSSLDKCAELESRQVRPDVEVALREECVPSAK